MGNVLKWTRRGFLAAGGLIGGGLVLGVALAPNRLGIKGSQAALNTWIKITPDNRVVVIIPHCEMGQGAQLGLAMMAADELDADWDLVGWEEAPALPEFANEYMVRGLLPSVTSPMFLGRALDGATLAAAQIVGLQVTGGSSSVRATGDLGMRLAGAAARQMLVQAAAARWGVAAASCSAAKSLVTHAASGRSLNYGALAGDAALLAPPEAPVMKARAARVIMGTSPKRPDIPLKVTGQAKFGIDTVLPGMLYATVRAAPVHGAKLVSVDEAVARAMPGVKAVVRLADGVAVVADGYWRALQAVRALQPVFDDAAHAHVNSARIAADQAALLAGAGSRDVGLGDADAALGEAAHVITAEYSVPYLAHATMEPPNATVRIADGVCEVWTGVQDPLNARAVLAKAVGLPRAAVSVHNCFVGGGFGRKLPFVLDFVEQAGLIAKAVAPHPVKTIWSREEDIKRDYYRPSARVVFKGGLDGAGALLAWHSHYTGDAGENAARLPYVIPNQSIRGSAYANHVRTGAWRSVDHSQHGFFSESFVDELAVAAGRDPFAFRRDMLPDGGRHRAVLELVAAKAGWGGALPPGEGRGIALIEAFGSIVAQVAEVAVAADGAVRVKRVVCVVDCGDVVHPDGARAQIEGGIIFALSAALYGEITIENGAVAQENFSDYEMAKLADAPLIDVHFIESHAKRGGIGEVGVPAVAPAVANAIHAACGTRVRSLPFRRVALPATQHAALP